MDARKLFHILILILFRPAIVVAVIYNVMSFGAKPKGKSDSSNAFLGAWTAACASDQPATVYIPPGRFLVRRVEFNGKSCRSEGITVRIDGALVASPDYDVIGSIGYWMRFDGVNGVSIYGGTLDGRGANLWACKKSGRSCPKGATQLEFYNSSNIRINGLSSINSQMFHILIEDCYNVNLMNMKISAPWNSPNTDGIHVSRSKHVTIVNSHIGTGDDCISIGPGSTNLWIENLSCGPGHGVSIGSLGWDLEEAGVQNVTLKTATFTGTENGVRVKTWARPSNGYVRDVVFEHCLMVNVKNPIIIDQNYCPNNFNCPHQDSGVKIHNVTYHDIHGTSAMKVAIKLDCSKKFPCTGITFDEVNLTYGDQPADTYCCNAAGRMAGVVTPSC